MKITELETFVVGNPPPHFGGRYFIFLKLTTDDGVQGLGEVYGATFGPHLVAAHDRGGLRRARDRRRPVPHRAALARRLRQGLLRPARHLAARRAQRHRDGVLGHRRQGRREAGLRAARRARPRAPARLHVPLPRAGGRDRRLPRPRPRRRAGRGVRGTRLHGAQVRSGGPLHDVRPAAAGARGARPLRALHPNGARGGRTTAATCCSGRTASSRRPARSGLRGASRRTTRSGSRSRRRPSCRRRWRGWRARPRSRSRPESG